MICIPILSSSHFDAAWELDALLCSDDSVLLDGLAVRQGMLLVELCLRTVRADVLELCHLLLRVFESLFHPLLREVVWAIRRPQLPCQRCDFGGCCGGGRVASCHAAPVQEGYSARGVRSRPVPALRRMSICKTGDLGVTIGPGRPTSALEARFQGTHLVV
ncbi:unnamed protein product [Symbiodinium necroappetens]|uniref:Uncharacterized protein n=1 Tax=Symbiodinium necroappetens TaxID=1628268 RepID=A0A812XLH2_9DINO|nr:unnamed protein product [Symbiodinium necroappetens]